MHIFMQIRRWFDALFHYAFVEDVKHKEKPLRDRKRYKRKPRHSSNIQHTPKRTIAATLNNLDDSFNLLAKADWKSSWMPNSSIRALRKMGPFMPPPDYEVNARRLTHPNDLPGIMFVGTDCFPGMKGDLPPSYLCAIRKKTKPPFCVFVPGAVFEIGAAFASHGRLFWSCFYVAVQDGAVVPIRYRYSEFVRLPKGRGFFRRENGFGSITEWAGNNNQDPDEFLSSVATMAFNFWAMRKEFWRVIVSRRGVTMNFTVPVRDTKVYFSDRDRCGVTRNGRLLPIAHYVEGHERKYPNGTIASVKPHIRGLRDFQWNDYWVRVKSPEFGGVFVDESFRAAAADDDDPGPLVNIDEAMDRLVEYQ